MPIDVAGVVPVAAVVDLGVPQVGGRVRAAVEVEGFPVASEGRVGAGRAHLNADGIVAPTREDDGIRRRAQRHEIAVHDDPLALIHLHHGARVDRHAGVAGDRQLARDVHRARPAMLAVQGAAQRRHGVGIMDDLDDVGRFAAGAVGILIEQVA